MLAWEVVQLAGAKRIDGEAFIERGQFNEWKSGWSLPDTPLMKKAIEDLEKERAMHEQRRKG